LRILILRPIRYVVSRQQHLSNWLLQVAKQLIPQGHQSTLTDSSERLDFWEVFRAAGKVHTP
jgi:hypothetical protein